MKNRKILLQEQSQRIKELMGIKENIFSDLIDDIKNSEIYKNVGDFFTVDDDNKSFDDDNKSFDDDNKSFDDYSSVPENIIIGDSQTPYVDMNTSKASRISTIGGESSLWLGGMGVPWLINALNAYPKVENGVKNVITVIGTNGNFGSVFNEDISTLFLAIKKKFPNAKVLVVQGSWGWGGLKNTTEKKVRDYYKKFEDQGGKLIEPPIGNVEPHSDQPVYKKIGTAIDDLIN